MTEFIDRDGTWAQIRTDLTRVDFSGAPALFLDRDGTIVEEVLYLHKPEEMELISGSANTINRANAMGIPVVITSNQSGVGRGYYGWPEFCAVQELMLKELDLMGARIDAIFACPYHIDGTGPYVHKNHPDRKPNPGMLLKAQKLLSIDLHQSWIVGDRASDIGAGYSAKCAGGVHLKSGHGSEAGEEEKAEAYQSESFRVLSCQAIDKLPDVIPFLNV